jgi:hypothetical protein
MIQSRYETAWIFDENDRLKDLGKPGDPLERLNTYIDWEQFCGILNKALQIKSKGPGSRPPFDYVMMFKILVLQRLYNISDTQAEYQIKDHLSFMRFPEWPYAIRYQTRR